MSVIGPEELARAVFKDTHSTGEVQSQQPK